VSFDDPFAEVHRRNEQRRAVQFGVAAVGVVGAIAVLAFGGWFRGEAPADEARPAPTANGSSARSALADPTSGPTHTTTAPPAERAAVDAVPDPPRSDASPSLPDGLAPIDSSSIPIDHPTGYVLAWGRIFVREAQTGMTLSPKVGDCVLSSGRWELYGLAYTRAPCADAFTVRAMTPFADGDAGSIAGAQTRFQRLGTLAWSSCFSLFATGAAVEDHSYYDPASNLMHWDVVTEEGSWVVEPAPGQLVCLEHLG